MARYLFDGGSLICFQGNPGEGGARVHIGRGARHRVTGSQCLDTVSVKVLHWLADISSHLKHTINTDFIKPPYPYLCH